MMEDVGRQPLSRWDAEARSGARFAQDHDRWNVFMAEVPELGTSRGTQSGQPES
jgi:hypothetical protein